MAQTMQRGSSLRFRNPEGFTYVIVLCALVLFGLGLAAFGRSWSMASQRLKEEELIRIGNEMVRAIGDYYQHPPGTAKTYPKSLDDLVEDKRFVGMHRHLRRIYRDPLTLVAHWGTVVAPDGGIIGIYSLNPADCLRQSGVMLDDGTVVRGRRYVDWKFIYEEKTPTNAKTN